MPCSNRLRHNFLRVRKLLDTLAGKKDNEPHLKRASIISPNHEWDSPLLFDSRKVFMTDNKKTRIIFVGSRRGWKALTRA